MKIFPVVKISSMLLLLIFIGCGKQDSGETIQIARDDQGNLLQQTTKPLPWTNLNLNNDPKNFQFIIVTDRTGGNRPGVFVQGIEKINLLQPEFVVSVGDLIQGYTDDPLQVKKEWDEFDEFVNRLEMPFFYVPGNHDITNKMMEEMWRERYGPLYYYFVYRNVLFLCLNSEEALTAHRSTVFTEEQVNFVKKTLEAHPEVRWTLIFYHKPIWLADEYEGYGKAAYDTSRWGDIESLLKDRKYTVFAGHIHRYTHRIRQQREYITLATMGGGSSLRGPDFGQFDHVMWVTMTDDGPIMANLMLDGIWDKDFTAEDIEKNLFLLIHGKAVKTVSRFKRDEPLISQPLEMQLHNIRDLPMDITMTLDQGEHISFSPEKITKTIQPNSVGTVKVNMKVINPEDKPQSEIWREFRDLQARWEVIYNFERVGKIVVRGAKDIY
jgi:hypothetical protein